MRRLITVVTIGALLTGCSGIPSSAPIKYGNDVSQSGTDQYIQVIGRPPIAGMDQTQIVKGFLAALADSRSNYSVAKQYLSTETANIWRPNAGITIYEPTSLEVIPEGEQVSARFSKYGEVDTTGYLNISPAGSQYVSKFGLTKNADGQWRIDTLADGILLSTSDLDRGFNSYPAYFLSADRKRLVADAVLVSQNVTGSTTALVQALLNGPSTKLALATYNAFPTGTKLSYGSVPIDQGVASVDLTEQVLTTDQATRAQLCAQIVWTLSSLPNVSSVQISVSGQPFTVSGLPNIQKVIDWNAFNPKYFDGTELVHFIRGKQVIAYDLDGTETVVAQVGANSKIELGSVAGVIDGGGVAAISANGKQVFLSTGRGGELRPVSRGDSISKPSWDQSGSFYYSDYGIGIFEINSKGQTSPVNFDSTSFAGVNQVKQIAVARDGIRVALVISNGSVDYLLGGALVKSEVNTRIVGLHLLERNITSVDDIAWQSPTSLAVLGSDASGGHLIFDVDLGTGTSSSISAPLNAQTVASSIGKQLYVGTSAGTKTSIAKQSGSIWMDLVSGQSPYLAK